MPRVVALGTSAALPHDERELTYLLLDGDTEAYLVDCCGGPLQRLMRLNVPFDKLEGLIVTHHHPDHVYGVPVLLTGLWLHGRNRPFHIHAPGESIVALQALGDIFAWQQWPQWQPIAYHTVPGNELTPVLESQDFRISGSPGQHLNVKTLAVRVESKRTGGVIVYSSDTEPCESIARLASGADVLIHEATGAQEGHSGPLQAGAVAARAGAGRLVLVHYPRAENGPGMAEEAAREFDGPIDVAEDFWSYQF